MANPAVLFLRVPAVSPERTPAYEHWYDRVHIPYRMDKPGFLGAQRYDVHRGHTDYLVFYEMSDPMALTSEPYLALRAWEAAQPPDSFEGPGSKRPGIERDIFDQTGGPTWPAPELQASIVHVAGYHPPKDQTDAFGAWFRGEHLEALAALPGVLATRTFAVSTAPLGEHSGLRTGYPAFVVVTYLESEEVVDDAAYAHEIARARAMAYVPDQQPYEFVGKLVHTAHAAAAADPAGA